MQNYSVRQSSPQQVGLHTPPTRRCLEDESINGSDDQGPEEHRMREAFFTISPRPDGTLIGENASLGLVVCGMDRESLQEEARDALIRAVGKAHVTYRVRLQQGLDSSQRLPGTKAAAWAKVRDR
ncbi:MAG: hypothetical protein WD136_06495 [Cyanobium sp.]